MFYFIYTKHQSMVTRLVIAFLVSLAATVLFSCNRKQTGDPTKFKELQVTDVFEKNPPEGLVLKKGELSLADGYELVYTDDSSKALFARISTGGGTGGSLAMRCDCDGLIKIGCIVESNPIFTCRSL